MSTRTERGKGRSLSSVARYVCAKMKSRGYACEVLCVTDRNKIVNRNKLIVQCSNATGDPIEDTARRILGTLAATVLSLENQNGNLVITTEKARNIANDVTTGTLIVVGFWPILLTNIYGRHRSLQLADEIFNVALDFFHKRIDEEWEEEDEEWEEEDEEWEEDDDDWDDDDGDDDDDE